MTSVSVLPDGRVVSGSGDNTIRIWDLSSGEGHTVVNKNNKIINIKNIKLLLL